MRPTVEIPEELFRAAKAKAALEGRKLRDLVIEGLQLVVAEPPRKKRLRKAKFPIIEGSGTGEKITDEMVYKAFCAVAQHARGHARPAAHGARVLA